MVAQVSDQATKVIRCFAIGMIHFLLVTSARAAGPTENINLRHSNAYASDEKWWRCDPVKPEKGCVTGTFDALGLSKEEQAFIREKLDRIAWRPMKTDKVSVVILLGAKPDVDVGIKQIYARAGPGSDPSRGVSLYYHADSVFMVHWFQPGRFLLVRASAL